MAVLGDIMRKIIVGPGKCLVAGFCFILFTLSLDAQIYVGGQLTNDETWSDISQPYILVESIVIPDGISLYIQPGVNIYCEPGTGFKIDGNIIAAGTSQDSIRILSLDKPWIGLDFLSVNTETDSAGNYLGGSILSFVCVQGASTCISLEDSTGIIIENCTIKDASFGIIMNKASRNFVRNNLIINTDFGIFIQSSEPAQQNVISGNEITFSLYVGILFNNSNNKHTHNILSSNVVSYCQTGLYLGNYGPGEKGLNTVQDNIFRNNETGVKIFQDSIVFRQNYVFRNRKTGLELLNSKNSLIFNNVIAENNEWGLLLNEGTNNNQIEGNNIYGNAGGFILSTSAETAPNSSLFIHNSLHHCPQTGFLLLSPLSGRINFNNIYSNGDTTSFVNHSPGVINCLHNWWGTTDTTSINNQIYDALDDSSLGLVQYQDFLVSHDLTAPISAPINVVKKSTGSGMLISWSNNPESDLMGYRIYYGHSDGIHFEFSADIGRDTIYLLTVQNEDDSIAVTAYDIEADGINDALEGHESEYAYAFQAPFAGEDRTVCAADTMIRLSDATSPICDTLVWRTSGDGYFEDINSLNTIYIPGGQDKINGLVILTLNVMITGVEYVDQIIITLKNAMHISAGNDTLICSGNSLYLNHAFAQDFDSLKWFTTGDGYFLDDMMLHTKYLHGSNDELSGRVRLCLQVYSVCGVITDTIEVTIIQGISIQGKVHASDNLAQNSRLILYRSTEGNQFNRIDQAVSENGIFEFNSILKGNYLIYAIPDKENLRDFVPAYFFDAARWEQANPVHAFDNTYDVDIVLNQKALFTNNGTCEIKGHFYCNTNNQEDCSYVVVLLFDRNVKNLLGWNFVSDDSTFEFSNLPYGDYVLIGEKPGFHNSLPGILSLTPDHPSETEVKLTLIPYKMSFYWPEKPEESEAEIYVSPNPANDFLSISLPSDLIINEMRLINSIGETVFSAKNTDRSLSGVVNVDVTKINPGICILEIRMDQQKWYRQKILVCGH